MSEVIAEAGGHRRPAGSRRCPARTWPPRSPRGLPASAVVAADGPGARGARRRAARRAGGSGSTSTRTSSASSWRARSRTSWRSRPAPPTALGLRRQRQGRAADARAGRDDAARDRGGRQPADVRGAGGDGRPHRDVRLAAVAQPPARRGAGQGPVVGRDRGRPARARPRAPTRSRPRSRSPTASASRCRSPARSSGRCSRARASSAAWSTCSPANRRTSWPTRPPGWHASGRTAG